MKQLKFYGLGGQGVVTAGKILSTAVSIYEDKYAITVPAYGHERRGAPVFTDVIVDDGPISLNCFVYEPDIVMVLDETIMEKNIDVGVGTHPNTLLVLNTGDPLRARDYRDACGFYKVFYVDATRVALDCIGRGIPNGAMLGALAHTGIVSLASVKAALGETFKGKAGERNANSASVAYEKTAEI